MALQKTLHEMQILKTAGERFVQDVLLCMLCLYLIKHGNENKGRIAEPFSVQFFCIFSVT